MEGDDPTEAGAPTFVEPVRGRPRKDLESGDTVGRYVVTEVIGRGGMGIVYLAYDPQLDRKVALKLLLSKHDDKASLVREAKALAKLSDPHVVAVYDAGEVDDRVFLAMQYVDGEDLAKALERRQPAQAQCLAWFVAAGRGLAAAHAVGMVHRDFKPRNVLIDRKDHVAVTDFGLADDARPDPARLRVTAAGSITGTPAYMAPEQFLGARASEASDQFAFCVSLWQALFGQHPYIAGDTGEMSPYAISVAIKEGPLLAPRRSSVTREVIDALSRGLARDPAQRWPSMPALLHVLAPPPRRRIWPLVVAGAVAVCASAALIWTVATRDTPASCAAEATARTAEAWTPGMATQLASRFNQTGRAYAGAAAAQTVTGLDHYAMRWQQLASDVCSAERSSHASPALAARRWCLDARLDGLRTVAAFLTSAERAELVDHAQQVVEGLPDLGDCTDTSLLGGPGVPPIAIAAQVSRLDTELAVSEARMLAGDYQHAVAEIAQLAAQADQLGWAPSRAHAHYILGRGQISLFEPARAELETAAEVATTNHLDREAARAWSLLELAAAQDHSADATAAIALIAKSAAARTGDRVLEVHAEIQHGRALTRLHQWKAGAAVCEAVYAMAQTLDDRGVHDRALDCMLESLEALARWTELAVLVDKGIAERSAELGPDHPVVADYLKVKVDIAVRHGKFAEARAMVERMQAIRKRVYPPNHYKMIEVLRLLGDVTSGEGKEAEGAALYEQALALSDPSHMEQVTAIAGLHSAIGMYQATLDGDAAHASAIHHLGQAVDLLRKQVGPDSVELAIMLINYGQVKSQDSVDAAFGLIGEARAILEANHDKRAISAGIAMAVVATNAKRYADVRKLTEEVLAHSDKDDPPQHVALTKWLLARALAEPPADPARSRKLALEAKQMFEALGPSEAFQIGVIDKFLAKH